MNTMQFSSDFFEKGAKGCALSVIFLALAMVAIGLMVWGR